MTKKQVSGAWWKAQNLLQTCNADFKFYLPDDFVEK